MKKREERGALAVAGFLVLLWWLTFLKSQGSLPVAPPSED
jgi:hypothetical protein